MSFDPVHVIDRTLPVAGGRLRTVRSRVAAVDWRSERGQATTEYALVLLAAALVGVLVIGWATAGGGAAAIGRLFDSVIESVIDQL
jgi:hypothetical protein